VLCRYHKDDIYTWVGATHSVLISVNPFKQLPIYTIPIMHHFAKPSPNRLLPPHTFALASNAYLQMRVEGRNQAVLISGESGAGTQAERTSL
jgi:myosin-7